MLLVSTQDSRVHFAHGMRLILVVFLLLASPVLPAGFELNGRALGDRSDEVLNDPR